MFEAILIILGLFVVALLLKRFLPRLCAICFSVSLTWLYGFSVSWNPVILAMLMGGSAVGLMYYLGGRWSDRFGFFKLPYLVTAFSLIWIALERAIEVGVVLGVVAVWLVFLLIYALRRGRGRNWFEKVVQCCKNW